MNFLNDIYILANIKRYSTVPTLRPESVAEHGYMVAAIVCYLHGEYTFNLGEAITMAIAHDMTEIELNDCPHITKEKYPEIAEAYRKCEKQVAKDLPPVLGRAVLTYVKGCTVEAKIVQLADVMQCMQYADQELTLGNKGYMNRVHRQSRDRVHKLKGELIGHIRQTKTKEK